MATKKRKREIHLDEKKSVGYLHPHLLDQIQSHPKEFLFTIGCDATVRVVWKCPDHKTCDKHVWKSAVLNRVNGSKCAWCMGNKICPCDSIATKYPELARRIVESPAHVTRLNAKCQKKIKIRCADHTTCDEHVWQTNIRNAVKGVSCPWCVNRKACRCNSVATLYPTIASEMKDLDPNSITPQSRASVTFTCGRHNTCDEHVYTVKMAVRIQYGCPYCSGRRICKCLSFGGRYPEIASEIVDKSVDVNKIHVSETRRLMWKCRHHTTCDQHQWESTVVNRAVAKRGCPFCSRQRLCVCDSVAKHEIGKYWHPTKNGSTNPESVSNAAKYEYWWKFDDCGHEFKLYVHDFAANIHCRECKVSAMEQMALKALHSLGIDFDQQKSFLGLVDKRPLHFDFYIPSLHAVIEMDGPQHFVDTNDGKEHYFTNECIQGTQKRDIMKNEYCQKNRIHILRVSYSSRKSILKHITNFIEDAPHCHFIRRFIGKEYKRHHGSK